MRDRDRANKNEIAIFAFSVTAKDVSHGVLPDDVIVAVPFGRSAE